MDQQSSSSLFSLPLELRQAIYSFLLPHGAHLYKREGSVLWSECIQPPTHLNLFGSERKPPGDPDLTDSQKSLYRQRLQSAWGPHWECEEAVRDHRPHSQRSPNGCITWLYVCKKSKTEMLQYLMSAAVLYIAGLEDLQFVLLKAQQTHYTNPEPTDPMHVALSAICHLDVILRLPLQFFEEIDRMSHDDCFDDLPPSEIVRFWMGLSPVIADLPKLSTLRFWIDHNRSRTWTVVNERAVLAPLDAVAAVRPEIKVTVNLPLLHPKWESWERHFVPGCSPPAYIIQRRVRQRCHVFGQQDTGSFVRHISDFPILYEGDWSSDDSLETTQREEREMWESGVDVEQHRRYLSPIVSYIPGRSIAGTSSDSDDSGDQSYLLTEVVELLRPR